MLVSIFMHWFLILSYLSLSNIHLYHLRIAYTANIIFASSFYFIPGIHHP